MNQSRTRNDSAQDVEVGDRNLVSRVSGFEVERGSLRLRGTEAARPGKVDVRAETKIVLDGADVAQIKFKAALARLIPLSRFVLDAFDQHFCSYRPDGFDETRDAISIMIESMELLKASVDFHIDPGASDRLLIALETYGSALLQISQVSAGFYGENWEMIKYQMTQFISDLHEKCIGKPTAPTSDANSTSIDTTDTKGTRFCYYILLIVIVFVGGSLALGAYFTTRKNQLGDGFTAAGWLLSVGGIILGPCIAIHYRDCTCWTRWKRLKTV